MSHIKNLLATLLGLTPSTDDQQTEKEELDRLSKKVEHLDYLYKESEKKLDYYEKEVASYQNLIEELRRRIADKDEIIRQYDSLYNELSENCRKLKQKSDDGQ